MKAKEYAAIYKGGKPFEIVKMFIHECRTIAESRNCTSDIGMYGIMNQQDQKWRAFCRLTDNEYYYLYFDAALEALFESAGNDEYQRFVDYNEGLK